jgi:hypothetical protein
MPTVGARRRPHAKPSEPGKRTGQGRSRPKGGRASARALTGSIPGSFNASKRRLLSGVGAADNPGAVQWPKLTAALSPSELCNRTRPRGHRDICSVNNASVSGRWVSSLPSEHHAAGFMLLSVVGTGPPHDAIREEPVSPSKPRDQGSCHGVVCGFTGSVVPATGPPESGPPSARNSMAALRP